MPRSMNKRTATASLTAVAVLLCTLVAAATAGATTYYACVKKNGTARIYTSKQKCKKGEKRLSWNSEGPAGRQGVPGKQGLQGKEGTAGKNGSNGLNGTGPGFFGGGEVVVSTATENIVGEKAIPAGSFIVSGLVEIRSEGSKAGLTGVKCQLADEKVVLDTDYSDEGLAEFLPTAFFGIVTLPTMAALNTTTPTKLSLACVTYFNTGGASVLARKWAISALQTSSNG